MKIRIDPHLEKFEVIRQLKALITEYGRLISEGKYADPKESFYDYLYYHSLDPVRKFLMLCIPEDKVSEEVDYDTLLNYYTSKFLSFRGTLKVFDYLQELKDILGVELTSYTYTVTTLEVNFDKICTVDINLFTSMVRDFFYALLYFQDYIDAIKTLQLDLYAELKVNLSGNVAFFTLSEVTEEVVEGGDVKYAFGFDTGGYLYVEGEERFIQKFSLNGDNLEVEDTETEVSKYTLDRDGYVVYNS
ncbi:MAG: hypothetical protein HUJ56_13435 [Erysipelotrichaceae bacterium]|nr:hypothetical protein [Erysipelotrichaceae bacterium]